MSSSQNVALIAGVSGIIGVKLAEHLLGPNATQKWTKVYGASRRKPNFLPEQVQHIGVDLQNQDEAKAKLGNLKDVTHVFCSIWLNVGSEEENVRVNGNMIANLLDGLEQSPLQHVSLVTGGKHYIGPFDQFGTASEGEDTPILPTPFKERLERLNCPNFYYAQEDVVFDRAAKRNFTWSVARPSIIVGYAPTNQMNMGSIFAAYATLCKYTGEPFVFPGTTGAMDIYVDCTDSQLLSEHLEWSVSTPSAKNQAFNVINGDVIRWRLLWEQVAKYFGLEAAKHPGKSMDMEEYVKTHSATWDEIVKKYGLQPYKLEDLLQGWFANVVLSAEFTMIMDMCKARDAGFLRFQDTEKSFFSLFDHMRKIKVIP